MTSAVEYILRQAQYPEGSERRSGDHPGVRPDQQVLCDVGQNELQAHVLDDVMPLGHQLLLANRDVKLSLEFMLQ